MEKDNPRVMDKPAGQDGKETFSMSSLEEEQLCPDDPTLPGYVQQGNHWETPPDVREGQVAMSGLEERIARLISPDAWETVARGEAIGLPSAQVFVNDSLKTARRVIDGLGLHASHATVCGGVQTPLIFVHGQILKDDDAPEPPPRVRQIDEED